MSGKKVTGTPFQSPVRFTDEQLQLLNQVRRERSMKDRYDAQIQERERERFEQERRLYEAQRTILTPDAFPMRALDDLANRMMYLLGQRDRQLVEQIRSQEDLMRRMLMAIERVEEMVVSALDAGRLTPASRFDGGQRQRKYRKD